MTGRGFRTRPIAIVTAVIFTIGGGLVAGATRARRHEVVTGLEAAELMPLQVTHYDVRLEPLVASKSVTGSVALSLNRSAAPGDALALDRGELIIDAVEQDGQSLTFETPPRMLVVTFPALTPSAPATPKGRAGPGRGPLTIRYHGTPKFGLEFAPDRPAVYTIFSTSQWVVADDAPSRRATWRLSLIVPRGWTVIAAGREVGRQPLDADREVAEWRQDLPIPSYTFGFVAGPMTRISEQVGSVTLEYAAHGLTPEQLRTIFHESAGMLDFFRKRTGAALPGSRYAQVLVPDTIGQEMAGLSLFSDEYGQDVLQDPQAIGLLAHEFAHQWWGNMVTNAAWTHFWLNEGFATFMAAAYRESRFGREVYRQDIERMKARYERAREAGHDRPLIFPNWDHPTSDDRAIVYQKGGYVLHLLREQLGDELFWRGIGTYTRRSMGRSVTTADFKREMQAATGRDLTAFFREWVE